MKAIVRNQSIQRGVAPQSPEQSASATSGTYFRAVRPTEAEAAAVARGEPVIDFAKVDRLCSTLQANLWRADSQVIAQRMIDDSSAASAAADGVAVTSDEDAR